MPCPSGYVADPNYPGCCMPATTTCPPGDFVAPPGGCGPDYTPDPLHPGCCFDCPNKCTSDSDCSPACGSGFLCENGLCQQPQLGSLTADIVSVTLPLVANYNTGTYGCGILGLQCCCKSCSLVTNQFSDHPWALVTITALDKGLRPMPGVTIRASYNTGGYWQTWSVLTGQPDAMTTTFTTGPDGTVQVALVGMLNQMPRGYGSASDYPCDACSDQYSGLGYCLTALNSGVIDNTGSVDTLTLGAPAWPGPEALVGVSWQISWYEHAANCLPGCPCPC